MTSSSEEVTVLANRPSVNMLALIHALAMLQATETELLSATEDALARLARTQGGEGNEAAEVQAWSPQGGESSEVAEVQTCNPSMFSSDVMPSQQEPCVLQQTGWGLFVVFKPPGWTVSLSNDGYNMEESSKSPAVSEEAEEGGMQEWVRHGVGKGRPIVLDKGFSCGFLHRLDKDTSGALLWSACYSAYYKAALMFAQRRVLKEYVCVCHGHFPLAPCSIEEPLQDWGERADATGRSICSSWGRPARTEVLLVGHLLGSQGLCTSLVGLRIHTGRRHQIRAHLSAAGHPLLGDGLYGAPSFSWCSRMFLHARRLGIDGEGEGMVCEVCLPSDLRAVLGLMQASDAVARTWARSLLIG